MAEDQQPRKPRPGPSVYDLREPTRPQQEPRRIAETDHNGVLRWRDNWRDLATGWVSIDTYTRGR